MSTGIIAGILKGAADVAVPAALEAQKSELAMLRQQRLQESSQAFQGAEAKASRDFTAGENKATREQASQYHKEDSDARAARDKAQAEHEGRVEQSEGKRLDIAKTEAERSATRDADAAATNKMQREISQMSIDDQKQIRDNIAIAIDPKASPEDKQKAIDNINLLRHESNKGYSLKISTGMEGDDTIVQQNNETGAINLISVEALLAAQGPDTAATLPPSPATPDKPYSVGNPATPKNDVEFAALPNGTPFINPKDGRVIIKNGGPAVK